MDQAPASPALTPAGGYATRLRAAVDAADRFARSPRAAQEKHQFDLLEKLVAHAHRASPFWRERLEASGWSPGRPFDRAAFERLPCLTRDELQKRSDDIRARPIDPAWGKIISASTSGSTGKPVTIDRIAPQSLHYDSATVLNHLWHQRDLSQKFVALRVLKRTVRRDDWGHPMALLYRTGPSVGMAAFDSDIESEYAAVQAEKPGYFLTQPSRALAFARMAIERGGSPHRIREFITVAETVTPDVRQMVREGFGAVVKDLYSTRDAGYLALQCRLHEHYHVLSEVVLVEVVGEDGRSAAPGQTGKVLVTILHSVAMPILRYDIGDVAVAGAGNCDCGLTLPTIESILGRHRNLARLADGKLRLVVFPSSAFLKLGPMRDYRLIQRGPDTMEVYVEWGVPLTGEHFTGITRLVQDAMGFPIEVKVFQVPRVEHSSASKREEFIRIDSPS